MKVTPENDPKAYLARKNDGLRHQIAAKEKEVELTRDLYKKRIDDERIIGEQKLHKQHELNQNKIQEVLQTKEERLEEIKQNFNQTAQTLEKERALLGDNHSQHREDLLRYKEHKYRNDLLDAQEETVALRQQNNEKLNQLRNDLNWKLEESRQNAEKQIQATQGLGSSAIANQKFKQEQNQRQHGIEHSLHLRRVKMDNERHLQEQLKQNESLLKEHEATLNAQINEKTAQFDHSNQQQEQIHKARYERLLKDHEELMETTRGLLNQEYESLVSDLTTQKQQFETRGADPFYRVNTIEPEIIDQLDSYVVRLQVAEHEKENVSLSPNGRQLKLHMVRNFNDRQVDEAGQVNKASRSETYTKIMQVPEILESRGITQRYVDGILEFKIAKK